MSFFSKTQVKDLKNNNQRIIRIAVSNVPINPTIAITTSNKIHLYNESGQKHQYQLSRSITPTCIQWHPTSPILTIGWDNGRITIWNQDTKAPKEQGKPHSDPIMMIRFNPSGSRMITSDLTGTIGVWRGINLLAVYQKQWAITHCVFSDIQLQGVKGNLGNLFLFAGRSGTVCLANDMNMCSDVCRVGGTIKALMFYQKEGSAIVITSNLLLVQFKINFTQKSVPEKKVKLSISGEPQNLNSIWIGESLLSTCSNQNMIRFWHLQEDQNYNLTVFDVLSSDNNSGMNLGTDKISSIVYDSRGRSLVAGTRQGRLMFWKNMALGTDSPIDKDQWAPQHYISLNKQIQLLTVGKNNGVIVCKQSDGQVVIVSETKITGKISGNYRAVLKSSDLIQVIYDDNKQKMSQNFTTMGHIKGIDLLGDKLLYWNNKSIQIVQINKDARLNKQVLSKIDQKPLKCLFANKDTFLITTDFGFNQMTLQGQVKQTFTFPQSQGKVLGIELMGTTLVLWTQSSYIRVFQVNNQIKQVGNSRRFEDSKGLIGIIRACSANSNGKKIGIVSNKQSSAANHSFHIYDIDSDSFISHDLGNQKIPVSIYWDQKDPRYIGVQVESSKTILSKDTQQTDQQSDNDADTEQGQQKEDDQKDKVTTRQFLTFFYTTQTGIRYQDKYLLKPCILDIFALRVPFYYSVDRNRQNIGIRKTTLHDFHRINYQDDIIKTSILNFSFHLTAGNLDQAYKSVKNIQNSAIWQKMAIMCVKSKRLDVAQICIGNMKFARGARSIREAKKQKQLQAQLGMVAIQLGMIDEAKTAYEQCKRYDLLSKVCQANGQIQQAIQIGQKHDRINLKNSYYNAAKYYQASNKYDLAIQFYQRSNTHVKQVPRMMLQCGKINQLSDYINNKKDKKLYTWLGQYNQSIGNLQQAYKYYEEGDSTSNLVRLHLSQNELQQSIKICNSQSEPQACFLLARHMEKNGMLSEAIHFYAKAQYYSQAVKIAIVNGLDGQIMSLSMAAPKQVAMRSGNYFQRKGLVEKAIRLYKKAGAIKKANFLAQKHGFTQLISIQAPEEQQNEIEQSTIVVNSGDKAAMTAKVNQLIDTGKYDRAVPLLVNLKQYQKALDICIQYNVAIQQELIKKMLPDQQPINPVQRAKRVQLTKTIAQKCRKQGSFQLASNLYVKLADKIKALKCLIQLGDTQKVILFANNARSPQTWILAANFLQTADWHQNSQLMKNIIQFYSKAKAYENLSSFFQACSNVEIDEYRDYDKALAALKQAIKHISKSTSNDRQAKTANLNYKRQLIQKFIGLRDLAQTNPKQMVKQYLNLLQQSDIQQTIRRGDIYAIIIQYYFQTQQYERCFNYLKQMKQKGIIITPYIDKQIIDGVYKALGITAKKKDEIQEEVIQDIS